MDGKRLVRYLYVGYILVVFLVQAAGGDDSFPIINGIKTVNVALLIGLIILLVVNFYVNHSEASPRVRK
ncbi:hypothetical protein [Haloferax larsenii]|uniref:Uncharacterized protein n=1 Tax=Haloferax larsenii TaxID=302484 RepID=A0A1H7QZ17_HALLR|nr:hypothetical protein [Haloferax larsenii]SEL52557.1 hypothetical protein SAMN04488691_105192 [Haloferax larsenii]